MSQRHQPHRAWLWTLLAVATVAGAFRLALDPVARHFTQRALDSKAGYSGQFDDLGLSVLRLRYRLGGVRLVRDPGTGHAEAIYVKALEARLRWGELWHLRIAGVLRIDDAKATYEIRSRAQLHDALLGAEAFADLPDLGGLIEGLIPFRITRVEVRASEVLVVDRTEHPEQALPQKSTELWLHGVEATVENFGSRNALLDGQPTTLALAAKLQRSGELAMFMTLDPLANKLDFEGEASVRHLPLEELYGFIVGLTELQPKGGTLDAFATFRCDDGYLDGALKPRLSNLELAPTEANVGNQTLATLGNAAATVAADQTPRHEISTVLPFGGRVTDPKAHLWPAVLALLGPPLPPGHAPLPADPDKKPDAPEARPPAKARPGSPPLSTSPQGVFDPGAVQKIQAALSTHGFADPATGTLAGPTQRQLVRFQAQQDLPETGFADRETLRQLGLDPEGLYRSKR